MKNKIPFFRVPVFATAFSVALLSSGSLAASIALDNSTTGDPSSSAFSFLTNHYEASEDTWVQSGLRFTTGSSATFLDSVIIPLVSSNTALSDLQIEIWDASATGGFWGTKLFTVPADSLVSAGGLGEWNNYEFLFGAGTELASDSQYWILYRNTVMPVLLSHQHALWLTSESLVPLSADAYNAFDTELGWTVDGAFTAVADTPVPDANNFKPGVWTLNATVVPEPSGGLLVGLTGVLLLGRRKRHVF